MPSAILLRLEKETAAKGLAALQNLGELLRLQKLFLEAGDRSENSQRYSACDRCLWRSWFARIWRYRSPNKGRDILRKRMIYSVRQGYVREEPKGELTPRRFRVLHRPLERFRLLPSCHRARR